MEMEKFCRSCGREAVPGNAFCRFCGGPLAAPGVDAGPVSFLTSQDFIIIAALMALALLFILVFIIT